MLFDCKMIINKLNIKENELNISVAVSCPYNEDATSPKVKIIFERGGKTRRLPLPVSDYFRQLQSDYCIVACSYSILIDKLFYNCEISGDITARIDFYYGDKVIESLPFTVADGAISEACGIEANCEGGRIVISETAITKEEAPSFAEKSRVLVPLIRILFLALRVVLALLLLPYFVIAGALSAPGILRKRHTKPIKGLLKNIFVQIMLNFSSFLKISLKRSIIVRSIKKPFIAVFNVYYKALCKKNVVPNRITFMSGRRDELSGNLKFVYDLIKDRSDIDFQFLLYSDQVGHNKIRNIIKFLKLYASSAVVVVDDYFRLLNMVDKRNDVKLYQLWHACGAFKTFGYTRLGKKGGPKQTDPNHRMYDYAIVSSQKIAKHYAEGFGLSDECIIATGIPRTDIFMDENYAAAVKERIFKKYPQLKDKKLMLFAPTFRGNGQMSAHYPTDVFHPAELYDALGGQYAILIKLHPFCRERFEIPEQYRDFIIDMSGEDELNDLLFVTDLLVTDYSSVIFEASLLDIPMVFYSFDLDEYISSRDFYYDYKSFVPGKIVYNERELIQTVTDGDFAFNKVNAFKSEFFDNIDGLSSQRVADHIINSIQGITQ